MRPPSDPDPDDSKHRPQHRRDQGHQRQCRDDLVPQRPVAAAEPSDRSSAGRCRPNSSRARCGSYPARPRRCATRHRSLSRPHRQARRGTEADADQNRSARSIDRSPRARRSSACAASSPRLSAWSRAIASATSAKRHRCVGPIRRMDRPHARRARHDIDRPVAALDQANARGVRDPAGGDGVGRPQ